ncbi:predicted protein [Plenodomus lingam JN3]|uniref:Predicted protein n=1 Tax=Leptosphaeria maculans (strain JN3 / isolate v23.1.3 / race Av1-4-5-6-7-8) TaxID=985895 RepID=E5A8L7_LEPMJ|nr:predicted protein [Plenodomus lingam JN3]CBX99962.1 predicted protein [Plenodomus lingam JN3]
MNAVYSTGVVSTTARRFSFPTSGPPVYRNPRGAAKLGARGSP